MSDSWCQTCGNICCSQAAHELSILRKILQAWLDEAEARVSDELAKVTRIALEEG